MYTFYSTLLKTGHKSTHRRHQCGMYMITLSVQSKTLKLLLT